VKRITTLAALAAAAALAGCSYSAESSFLGYRSSISYSTPGAAPPPSYYSAPPAYSPAPASPPPGYRAAASCYRGGFYNRWGYWVPGRYVC
jgi:hypothetical protein